MEKDEEGSVKDRIFAAFCDWQIWPLGFIQLSFTMPAYGLVFFLPTILNDFGYSASVSQLLTVPIFASAAIAMLTVAHYSDKIKLRFPFIMTGQSVALAGFAIQISQVSKAIKYFGLFACVIGGSLAVPCNIGWLVNNLHGKYKRAIGVAIQISIANIGGIIACNVFRVRDNPKYTLGLVISIGMLSGGLVLTVIMTLVYYRLNRAILHVRDVSKGENASAGKVTGLYVM